jgi:hypothetical protein
MSQGAQAVALAIKPFIDEAVATLSTQQTQHTVQLEASIAELEKMVTALTSLIADKKKPIKEAGKKADAPEVATSPAAVKPATKNFPASVRAWFLQNYKVAEFRDKYIGIKAIKDFVDSDATYKSKPSGSDAQRNAEGAAAWKYIDKSDKVLREAIVKEYEAAKSGKVEAVALTVEPTGLN